MLMTIAIEKNWLWKTPVARSLESRGGANNAMVHISAAQCSCHYIIGSKLIKHLNTKTKDNSLTLTTMEVYIVNMCCLYFGHIFCLCDLLCVDVSHVFTDVTDCWLWAVGSVKHTRLARLTIFAIVVNGLSRALSTIPVGFLMVAERHPV